jgi:hypothetical protein
MSAGLVRRSVVAESQALGFRGSVEALVQSKVLMEASQLSFTIGFEESVCFLISRALRCSCITNDPALTRYCVAGGIKVLSGLDILVCLVQCGSLAREKASVVARLMHESNPVHLTSDIINRFDRQLVG